jgi:hypothetical protein
MRAYGSRIPTSAIKGKAEECGRFNPPGLLTSEIHGERKIKAGDHGQVHRVEDLFDLRRQQGL